MKSPRTVAAAWQGAFILLCLLVSGWAARGEELQAGAAKIDITPPAGHPLWGYAARHAAPSTGVEAPLLARALVLAAGEERVALVSLDLGRAPARSSLESIKAKVKAGAGIQHLFLVASHTHHGPVIELADWPTRENSYVRELEEKIARVIGEANQARRPARIGVAAKEVALNRNRHSKQKDAPVDRELLVLRVEDKEGKPLAHAVNFAAHATLQDGKMLKISPDYPGALAAVVEKETGAPCLFLQGAAGDLSPNPAQTQGPEAFGRALGKEVLSLAATMRCERPEKTSWQVREEPFTFKSRIDLDNVLFQSALKLAFFPELVEFYAREYREGVRPTMTVALLNGRIGFVGVSGEFFCGHSLSLKRRARLEHLFFLGYCNDYQQYFPTLEAAAQGGYGTAPVVSPVEYGAGERMMDRALIDLFQMRGQLPEVKPREK